MLALTSHGVHCCVPRARAGMHPNHRIFHMPRAFITGITGQDGRHLAEFLHGKGDACQACRFDPICAGMFSMAKSYDEREISPIFDDPTQVIATVLRREPSPELMARLMARRGRRSSTEQPSLERRQQAMERPL